MKTFLFALLAAGLMTGCASAPVASTAPSKTDVDCARAHARFVLVTRAAAECAEDVSCSVDFSDHLEVATRAADLLGACLAEDHKP